MTVVGTATVAGATPTKINCAAKSTVTFSPPGLSNNGNVTTASTSLTKTAATTLSKGGTACTGSIAALSIKTTNIHCNASGATTEVPACTGHTSSSTEYGDNSWNAYADTGTASIKASIPTLAFKIGTITYTSKTSAAAVYSCPKYSTTVGQEIGFKISGKVTERSVEPPMWARRRSSKCASVW